MQKTSTPQVPSAQMPYPALVGQVVKHYRSRAGIDQAQMAEHMALSQSAYSRIESGDTTMNVWQLRTCCERLSVTPAQLLADVQLKEEQLRLQNVAIVQEKRANPAAAIIGIAILGAILAASGK
jgi:transcriptional regulator with XRE-family HTH domain